MRPGGEPATWAGGGGFLSGGGVPAVGAVGARTCQQRPIGGSSDGRGGLRRHRGRGQNEPGGGIGPWDGTEAGGRAVNYTVTE